MNRCQTIAVQFATASTTARVSKKKYGEDLCEPLLVTKAFCRAHCGFYYSPWRMK
jgi:hypothetical protein